jgi:hypothetical protein
LSRRDIKLVQRTFGSSGSAAHSHLWLREMDVFLL